jgi:hypothetical protein
MQRVPCNECHATSAMQRVPCNECHATSAMLRVPCNECHATSAMQRVPCNECHATSAMQRVPCNECQLFGPTVTWRTFSHETSMAHILTRNIDGAHSHTKHRWRTFSQETSTCCASNVSIVRSAAASSACSARSTTPWSPPSRRLCRSLRKAVATFCQCDRCNSQIRMSYLYVHKTSRCVGPSPHD